MICDCCGDSAEKLVDGFAFGYDQVCIDCRNSMEVENEEDEDAD